MIGLLSRRAASAARSRRFLCALAPAFFLAISLSPLRAAITATGDVDPANPSTWTYSTMAYVGNTGTGSLTANGGATLTSLQSLLGAKQSLLGAWDSAFASGYTLVGDLMWCNFRPSLFRAGILLGTQALVRTWARCLMGVTRFHSFGDN